jgi:hypothetical protein
MPLLARLAIDLAIVTLTLDEGRLSFQCEFWSRFQSM